MKRHPFRPPGVAAAAITPYYAFPSWHQSEGTVGRWPWSVHRPTCAHIRRNMLHLRAIAIQLARISAFYPIVVTASPHNTALLASPGATSVVDRNQPPSQVAAAETAETTRAPMQLALNAVAVDSTQRGSTISLRTIKM